MRAIFSFTKNEHDGREIRDNPFSIQRSTTTVLFDIFYITPAPRRMSRFPAKNFMIHDLE